MQHAGVGVEGKNRSSAYAERFHGNGRPRRYNLRFFVFLRLTATLFYEPTQA
jgi:hypothetical protein